MIPLPHTVTILRAARVPDAHGNESLDWSDPTRSDTRGWVQQLTATENFAPSRDPSVTVWRCFLPPDTDILYEDRLEHDGRTFDVDGNPALLSTPRGPHHIEALLRTVEG